MREYDDYEDLDRYETEGEYDEDGEDYEEDYEPKMEPKLTQEQLKYLELRRKLKESYRKQLKKESGSASATSRDRSQRDDFGSFFGPSQPVIAPRVIQESKSLLENQHLASRILNPNHSKKRPSNVAAPATRLVPSSKPKVDPMKLKAQMLKDTRDYSFLLSDDAAAPAPRKEPPLRKVSAPHPDSRYAQHSEKSRHQLSNGSRQVPNGREERRPVSSNGKLQHRPMDRNVASTSRQNPLPTDPRKQHVSNSRPALDRPIDSKRQPVDSRRQPVDSRRQPVSHNRAGTERSIGKPIPLKTPNDMVKRSSNAPVVQRSVPSAQRPLPPARTNPQLARQPLPQKKVPQDPYRPNMVTKPPASSIQDRQMNRPISKSVMKPGKPISSQSSMQDRPKKRPPSRYSDEEADDGFDYRSEIRNLFGYNPNKFRDDDDTSDMEAGFEEILKEERRSAKIARKEDEIEQMKIEEEERRERMRREAKKRKLSQSQR